MGSAFTRQPALRRHAQRGESVAQLWGPTPQHQDRSGSAAPREAPRDGGAYSPSPEMLIAFTDFFILYRTIRSTSSA